MKRIVIFCDGTCNLPDETTGDRMPCPTNVMKLAEGVSDSGDGVRQMVPEAASGGGGLNRRT